MTREEEILEAARNCFLQGTTSVIDAFKEGVEWADEHPKEGLVNLKDACEWLKENIDLYSYNKFSVKSGYTEITLTDEFETAFRQAMKGGAE